MMPCRRCGTYIPTDYLACPNCGLFVHVEELDRLAQNALMLEQENPQAAIGAWRDVLTLLPRDSQQYQAIRARIGLLSGDPAYLDIGQPEAVDYQRRVRPADTLGKAVLKTGLSLFISLAVYTYLWKSWEFALGFLLLIFVHEMGHMFAIWHYKLRAGAPVFIPFVGALIDLRQPPPNAKVEAVVGIGGPLLGAVGAFACYFVAHGILKTNEDFGIFLLVLAQLGFMLNLFNLLPVPPLDGGRITAAVNPKLWILGVIGLVGFFAWEFMQTKQISPIAILILMYAVPNAIKRFKTRAMAGEYYRVTKLTAWTIGFLYVLLGVALLYYFLLTKAELREFNVILM